MSGCVCRTVLVKLTNAMNFGSLPMPAKPSDVLERCAELGVSADAFTAAYAEIRTSILVSQIRAKRDALLTETDWLFLVDNSEKISNIEEWKTYRQALRDLPALDLAQVQTGENDCGILNWSAILPAKPQGVIRNV